jgi:cytochrome c-type biogenesis protein CcmF
MAVRKDEEPFLSREFWMFIGSLVFLFSSILITFTTSIPVFNKISDLIGWVVGQDLSHWHRTLPIDPIEHFNKFQFWIAILIGLLSGFTQYLRYDASPIGDRRKALIIRQLALVGATLVFCWLTWRWLGYISFAFHLLTFSAWYTVVANTDYLISFLKGNLSKSASNLAHLGFGLMLVGIIASGIQKQYISQNRFAMEGILSQDIINKNVLYLEKI